MMEKAIGHDSNAVTEQDITNPGRDRAKYADPSGETMKALVWNGKNSVKMGKLSCSQIQHEAYGLHQRRYRSQELLKIEMLS